MLSLEAVFCDPYFRNGADTMADRSETEFDISGQHPDRADVYRGAIHTGYRE